MCTHDNNVKFSATFHVCWVAAMFWLIAGCFMLSSATSVWLGRNLAFGVCDQQWRVVSGVCTRSANQTQTHYDNANCAYNVNNAADALSLATVNIVGAVGISMVAVGVLVPLVAAVRHKTRVLQYYSFWVLFLCASFMLFCCLLSGLLWSLTWNFGQPYFSSGTMRSQVCTVSGVKVGAPNNTNTQPIQFEATLVPDCPVMPHPVTKYFDFVTGVQAIGQRADCVYPAGHPDMFEMRFGGGHDSSDATLVGLLLGGLAALCTLVCWLMANAVLCDVAHKNWLIEQQRQLMMNEGVDP